MVDLQVWAVLSGNEPQQRTWTQHPGNSNCVLQSLEHKRCHWRPGGACTMLVMGALSTLGLFLIKSHCPLTPKEAWETV